MQEAVVWRCYVKKVFLEISQNSQENNYAKVSFLIQLQASRHRCFPANFVKFLRTPFLTEHLWWLLLFCIQFQITSSLKSEHFRDDKFEYSP